MTAQETEPGNYLYDDDSKLAAYLGEGDELFRALSDIETASEVWNGVRSLSPAELRSIVLGQIWLRRLHAARCQSRPEFVEWVRD